MDRALIFAHFDRDGAIDPYVDALLAGVAPHCRYRIFVSTAALSEDWATHARKMAEQVIVRENRGHDFVSYRQGLAALREAYPLLPFDEIVFANDSVYGPFAELGPWLARAAGLKVQAWGASVSHEKARHIQSYFFAARRELFRAAHFRRFWDAVEPLESKSEIIRRYEVAFSRMLAEGEVPFAGMFDPADEPRGALLAELAAAFSLPRGLPGLAYAALRARALNPTHYYAARMLRQGQPFLKIELLRDNPNHLDLAGIDALIGRTPALAALITAHLGRMRPTLVRWTGTR